MSFSMRTMKIDGMSIYSEYAVAAIVARCISTLSDDLVRNQNTEGKSRMIRQGHRLPSSNFSPDKDR